MPARPRPTPLPRRLPASRLRWRCPASWIPRERPRAGSAGDGLPLLGQERAVAALEMGLAIRAPGYNVFVTGVRAPEKNPALRRLLEDALQALPPPKEHVFLHNFEDPLRPCHLGLPPGGGARLQAELAAWVAELRRDLPRRLAGDDHQRRRLQVQRRYEALRSRLGRQIHDLACSRNLEVVRTGDDDEGGATLDLWFRIGGRAVAPAQVGELPPEEQPDDAALEKLAAAREEALEELQKLLWRGQRLQNREERTLECLDRSCLEEAVAAAGAALRRRLAALPEAAAWLERACRHARENPDLFLPGEGGAAEDREAALQAFQAHLVRPAGPDLRPLVFELHPTFANLFGTVERRGGGQGPWGHHLAVRPGSLLEADGGFLVLNAADVIQESEVWRALKRTLQNQRLEIHALDTLSPLGATGVRPGAVPLDIKVVLVGDNSLYEAMHGADEDLHRIFKVKAEFEDSLPLEPEVVGGLCRVLRRAAREEGLPPLARSGLQALVEDAVRDAGHQSRVSARIATLLDYLREAAWQAGPGRRVDRAAVEAARHARLRRHSLAVERYERHVREGILRVDTTGSAVGTVNGLVVVGLGPLEFGLVSRVSATVSAGEDTFLSVERETDQSGPLHSRGVLLLASYIRARFGQRRTLPVKVSLVFDQNHGPVDGDSASSTEVFALLSALAELPVRQDVAVTGALGMDGTIQAVGGVNEKIEAFFRLCRDRGLTGTQGVLLPAANARDLALDPEIVAAVRARRFHVWTMATVEEGITLLTGVAAGRRRADGSWPPDTVMGRVEARLAALERAVKAEGAQPSGKASARSSASPSGESSPECTATRRPSR